MSDVKITGQAVGTGGVAPSTARPAQVDKGAGVSTARPVSAADRVAVGGAPAARPAATPELAVQSGGNPFAALPGRDIPFESLRLSDRAVDLSQCVELPFEVLHNMAAAEAKLGAEHAEAFSKVREGVMLLTVDAQSARAGAGLKLDDLGKLSGKFAGTGQMPTPEEVKGALLAPRPPGALPIDINAFVQQVLRESYLIQCDLLRDYADKVKFYNELKKKIRTQLGEARETQSAWVAQKAGNKDFKADPPFAWVEFDANGNPLTPELTAKQLEAWETTGQAIADDGTAGLSSMAAQLNGVYHESKLTPDDRAKLDQMLQGSAVYLEGKGADISALLPKMNIQDFTKYVAPIMKTLTNASKGSVAVSIFKSMNPIQRLALVRAGFEEEWLKLGDSNSRKFQESALDAAISVASAAGMVWPPKAERRPGESAGAFVVRQNVAPEITGTLAKDLMTALEGAIGKRTAATAATAAATEAEAPQGTPKSISTTEQMETYIKELEEDLNSAGEDSQLANVDLQNALQRQQQTLQMMSNMSKMLHDTAMSIIRKIGS